MPAPPAESGLAAIIAWWDENAREVPWRSSRDVYAIWVSEVMSTQTSLTRASAAWVGWMARWPTVDALADAELFDVLAQWQGLGYPRRARDLHRAARIVAVHGWPGDLTELPGVGEYVAAAVRCFAREEPVLPLDVNVRRVLARRFPAGVDIGADPWRSGQALMEFGQRICAARPRCERCPARTGCPNPNPNPRPGTRDEPSRPGEPRDGNPDPAPRARRQAPYRGSLRERRGILLRRVLAAGEIAIGDEDRVAADSLVADGLARRAGDRLLAPR